MLYITIPGKEFYDDFKQEFVYSEERTIELEHSLVSLSKWESMYHKPFISDNDKTVEETIDYIKCMTLTEGVDDSVYSGLIHEPSLIEKINRYIDDPQTASIVIDHEKGKRSGEFTTSETIYYWMISLQIPFECQYWHLNRLIALIRFCSAKNAPKKKMSQREIMEQNRALNAARRKKLGTKG